MRMVLISPSNWRQAARPSAGWTRRAGAPGPGRSWRGRVRARCADRRPDLRSAQRVGQEANLVVFVVDLSGSMTARRRLAAVSELCVEMLRDSYTRRDRVAVVVARGSSATLAVPPTKSVEIAVRRLEEEGDIAADYVEELLDIADLDGDIDIEVRDGRTYVSVVSEDHDERLDGLVGPDGRTLEALQELVRLAVLAATGHRSRLILDVCGHRERRNVALRTAAQAAVERVRAGEGPVHLEPMGAYERKIVHDVVADAGLTSESEGEGARRHVVISADD